MPCHPCTSGWELRCEARWARAVTLKFRFHSKPRDCPRLLVCSRVSQPFQRRFSLTRRHNTQRSPRHRPARSRLDRRGARSTPAPFHRLHPITSVIAIGRALDTRSGSLYTMSMQPAGSAGARAGKTKTPTSPFAKSLQRKMLPIAIHYLQHRRKYSNLLMIGFAGYVVQNVSSPWPCASPVQPIEAVRSAFMPPTADGGHLD